MLGWFTSPHGQRLPALPLLHSAAWLCPEVEMEVPLLLQPQSTHGLFPKMPSLTRRQRQTQPKAWQPQVGCGRGSTTTVRHALYPQHRLSCAPARAVPSRDPTACPCTHIVGVEYQWMGTGLIPCPEGDTRPHFLAQGEQSQALGCCSRAASAGQVMLGVPAPWALCSHALGGRCAAAVQRHHGSSSASAGGPSARSPASPVAAPAGSSALVPGPQRPSLSTAALGKPDLCKTRHHCCWPGSNPTGDPGGTWWSVPLSPSPGSPSLGTTPPGPLTP